MNSLNLLEGKIIMDEKGNRYRVVDKILTTYNVNDPPTDHYVLVNITTGKIETVHGKHIEGYIVDLRA